MNAQLEGAIEYIKTSIESEIDIEALEKAAGINIEVNFPIITNDRHNNIKYSKDKSRRYKKRSY